MPPPRRGWRERQQVNSLLDALAGSKLPLLILSVKKYLKTVVHSIPDYKWVLWRQELISLGDELRREELTAPKELIQGREKTCLKKARELFWKEGEIRAVELWHDERLLSRSKGPPGSITRPLKGQPEEL